MEQRLIRVRFSKSKKSRYIPINDELLEVLKAVPRWDDCEYVFANPDTRNRWFRHQGRLSLHDPALQGEVLPIP